MNKSDTISELAKALSSFQGKMVAVKKDAVNPFYKSKYATLDTIWETIRNPLAENGLSVTQTLGFTLEGKSFLETTLYHGGEWTSGQQLLNPVKDDPQSFGSAISYARRYGLSAILGIVADEDDDANIATKPEPKAELKAPPPPSSDTDPGTIIKEGGRENKEGKISPAQTKKIYASVKEKGITADQAKAYLKEVFHKMSTNELTASEASRLIEDIWAGKLGTGKFGGEDTLVKAAKATGAKIIQKGEGKEGE